MMNAPIRVMIIVTTAQIVIICSMNHVSERGIFRRGPASQQNDEWHCSHRILAGGLF